VTMLGQPSAGAAGLVTGPVRVRVPASSANLGPGFDALGVALALHDVVTAQVADGFGDPARPGVAIECTGEGAGTVPRDASHLVYRAMVRGFGSMDVPVPGVHLSCENRIPHGRGLGSSSAAIVAGLATARALVADGVERMTDDELFGLAAEMEGHPDNVAPATYGGFTIAYGEQGSTDGFHAVRLDVDPAVCLVVLVPGTVLETRVARGLLPSHVPHADAARNAGRAALLVAALTGRPDQLMAATEDRLHQQYRAEAMPDSARLVEALRADGFPAVVSGAGPTVLALVAAEAVGEVTERRPAGWRATELAVDPYGVKLL
jgi:homoserine kinase